MPWRVRRGPRKKPRYADISDKKEGSESTEETRKEQPKLRKCCRGRRYLRNLGRRELRRVKEETTNSKGCSRQPDEGRTGSSHWMWVVGNNVFGEHTSSFTGRVRYRV